MRSFDVDCETRIAQDQDVYQVEIDGDELRIICYLDWQDSQDIAGVFEDDADCEGVIFETTLTQMVAKVIDEQSNRLGEVSHGELRQLRTILMRAMAMVDHALQRPDLDGKYPEDDD